MFCLFAMICSLFSEKMILIRFFLSKNVIYQRNIQYMFILDALSPCKKNYLHVSFKSCRSMQIDRQRDRQKLLDDDYRCHVFM